METNLPKAINKNEQRQGFKQPLRGAAPFGHQLFHFEQQTNE